MSTSSSRGTGVGVSIGAGLGVALAVLIGEASDLAIWIAMGAGVGVALGAAWDSGARPGSGGADGPEPSERDGQDSRRQPTIQPEVRDLGPPQP